jgi:hypothetical protein
MTMDPKARVFGTRAKVPEASAYRDRTWTLRRLRRCALQRGG